LCVRERIRGRARRFLCVFERERERGSERGKGGERERDTRRQ
jgi:hypothetical protein